jgi:hypothetical protein
VPPGNKVRSLGCRPSRSRWPKRARQDSQFCTHQKSGASRESPDRSEVLPVQHDVGYPSLCVPRSRQAPPPRSLPIPTKWCKDLYVSRFAAPLRRLEWSARSAQEEKNSRSRLESSILRPMQKTPTAGGGGLKGSKKNAKVTKKVWNMRFDVFSETDLQSRNTHVR